MPYESTGTLTTETKKFPEPTEPNLIGLNYTLNGQSIEIDVIGSPGEPSEETVSVTLDGATAYTLSWNSAHGEFIMEITLSTSNEDVTPEFDDGVLADPDPITAPEEDGHRAYIVGDTTEEWDTEAEWDASSKIDTTVDGDTFRLSKADGIYNTTINGESVTVQNDDEGSWLLVQNYEHYGGTTPSVSPGSTFPQLPNGLTDASDVDSLGTNGELRHVDNISQYGSWSVDAVRLEGYTTNHSRKVHYYTTSQDAIDSITGNTVDAGYVPLSSNTTFYPDHTGNLPNSANNQANTDSNHIFGLQFPMYNTNNYYWTLAGNGDRWEMDDNPSNNQFSTVHRVWVRLDENPIEDYVTSGTLVTEEKSAVDEATSLTTDTTIPTDTSIDVTVYQDTDGDDTAENSETVSLSGGTETLPLDQFTLTDSDYWAEVTLQTTDSSVTPTVNSIQISGSVVNPAESPDLTLVEDVGTDSTSATATQLLDGEEYTLLVEAYRTNGSRSFSAPASAVTLFQGIEGLVADASVEDTLTPMWDDTANYGSYRVEYRVSGSGNPYTDSGTVPETVTQKTIDSLLDGEEYDIRVRHETEHGSGDYTEISPITLLPSPAGLTATDVDSMGADLSWDDTADNEDDFTLFRRRVYENGVGSYGDIVTLSPNTSTYHEEGASPSTTYNYYVRVSTEHVFADSNTIEVTTEGTNFTQSKVPSSGIYLEVDHPDGNVLRPTVVGTPEISRALNDYPEVRIPVEKSDKWLDSAFDRATVRVWKNGTRLPVEEIKTVESEEGATVIVARGGTDFRQEVSVSYTQTASDNALRTLVQDNTDWQTNVDTVGTIIEEDFQVYEASTTAEFEQILTNIDDDFPLDISNDSVGPAQTTFFQEAEDDTFAGQTVNDGSWSGGQATLINDNSEVGDESSFLFQTDYRIPAENVAFNFRIEPQDNTGDGTVNTPAFEINFNGEQVAEFPTGFTTSDEQLRWEDLVSLGGTGNYTGADLQPDTNYELEIRVTDTTSSTDDLIFDCYAVYDDRYEPLFDNITNSDDLLGNPGLFPEPLTWRFDETVTPYNFRSADLETVWDDTTNDQQIALTNNDGADFTTADNSENLSIEFPVAGTTLAPRATSDHYGSRTTESPAEGFQSQRIQSLSLTATTDSRPVIARKGYSDNLLNVLQNISNQSDYVFELTQDGDTTTFQATVPGTREADGTPPISSFRAEKRQDSIIRKAMIKGASEQVQAETFTSDFDTPVNLENDNIIEGSTVVADADDSSVTFDVDNDYTIDYTNGSITVNDSGTMLDSTEYVISYKHKYTGSFEDTSVDGDTFIDTVPSLTSDQSCAQVARILQSNTDKPVWVADVEIPTDKFNYNLVDELSLDQLPDSVERLEVWDVSESDSSISLRLGSRDEVGELLTRISSRLAGVSDQT